ncbi:MAG TPA: iron-containing alcohol dehydrogenase [Thermoanaerobaculia bacterium]|nr:iron-containing alcohol dehydrogenase [Thermoanaerobaculia bacterium]
MNLFTFQLYPRIHYGCGAAAAAGSELARLGVRRALVVTDPGVLAAGVADPVLAALAAAGVAWEVFSGVETNPTDLQVMAAAAAYARADADGLVGLGGGSAMDVAKSAAVVVSSGGHIRDYEDGRRAATAPHPPLVFIPTTAGTGSEAVGGTIIVDTSRMFKMHVVAVPGHAALCDPLLTVSLPPWVTAATGLDALSHAIGAYVSVERQPLADAYALYAIELVSRWLLRAIAHGSDQEARAWMMVASLTAGIAMKGGGSGEHAFAHGINVQHRVHHGQGCAIFLADVMDYNLPGMVPRYARIAQAMGIERGSRDEEEQARAGIAAVRALVAAAGTPRLRDVGVAESHVTRLVDYVMQDTFHLGLNPVPIAAGDAERILRTTLAA